MVSLAGIEALAADLWPDRPSAVAAVPDPRKGERLILFTQEKGASRAAYQTFAKSRGASDVAIPAEVVVLEAIPMLGTGKIDQVAVIKLAQERAKESAAA
jgi:acyl-[acyl-carrier-protein]-phospholipid O-acyltransferase / long-chain-fatty-acid--[acyl-carrier-protein] ligase